MHTELPDGYVLTVTAATGASGTLQRIPQSGDDTAYPQTPVTSGSSVAIGPFTGARYYEIQTLAGSVTYALSEPNEESVIGDTPGGLFANPMVIPVGKAETIPADTQVVIYDSFTVRGDVTVLGTMRICGYPT